MSTSKTFMIRDFYRFFKNNLEQLRDVKPLGKASLHMSFLSFTIRINYFQENVIVEVFYMVLTLTFVHVSLP